MLIQYDPKELILLKNKIPVRKQLRSFLSVKLKTHEEKQSTTNIKDVCTINNNNFLQCN